MKLLSSREHFLKSMRTSRADNSHANNRNWVIIELGRDFMPVLVIFKFDKDPIKYEVVIVWRTFSPLYGVTTEHSYLRLSALADYA